jgi:hypothetical protein
VDSGTIRGAGNTGKAGVRPGQAETCWRLSRCSQQLLDQTDGLIRLAGGRPSRAPRLRTWQLRVWLTSNCRKTGLTGIRRKRWLAWRKSRLSLRLSGILLERIIRLPARLIATEGIVRIGLGRLTGRRRLKPWLPRKRGLSRIHRWSGLTRVLRLPRKLRLLPGKGRLSGWIRLTRKLLLQRLIGILR